MIYLKCLKAAIASMSELFTIPQDVEINLTQALDETWFP